MTFGSVFTFLWKLAVCALAYGIGVILGGTIAGVVGLPAPTMPPEIDANAAMLSLFATSPLLVLALYFVGRKLAGGWLARTGILALLTWIAYTVNNAIEAAIFTNFVTDPRFTVVTFTPAALLCGGAVAWLFPPQHGPVSFTSAWRTYVRQRTPAEWAWRLLVAAVIFMPIYYLFGALIVPLVGDYYRQGAFGLTVPPLTTLLPILLVRSVLFLVACWPVVIAWRGTRRSLWLSLGFALFVLVGLLYMLAAHWIAPTVRLIHSLEILADSLVYTGALVWLLAGRAAATHGATALRLRRVTGRT